MGPAKLSFIISEYLVKNKYAAASKVAINGASNGGMMDGIF